MMRTQKKGDTIKEKNGIWNVREAHAIPLFNQGIIYEKVCGQPVELMAIAA